MPHLVLLGDSIFDNGFYTGGEPDVISRVRELLPEGWKASLVAVDGSSTEKIPAQVERIPLDATHIILSVGGNDAIESLGVVEGFENRYRGAVEACRKTGLPLTVCTIYHGCFSDPDYQRSVVAAIIAFNDVIIRVAGELKIPVIDLRLVCTEPTDFSNSIEPSAIGGAKIALCIVEAVKRSGTGGVEIILGRKLLV
jgi:hypothetical protein